MAVNVNVLIQRDINVACNAKQAFDLLSDIHQTSALFPKVDKVEPLGEHKWVWEIERMGSDGLTHQVKYAVKYGNDGRSKIHWHALPDVGNAKVSGEWIIKSSGQECTLFFKSSSDLELPFPRLMQHMMESVIRKEMDEQVDTFLSRIKTKLEA